MNRILYILLSLCLVFNTNAQVTGASFHGALHTPASGGGGGGCGDADANAYLAEVNTQSGITITPTVETAFCDFYTNAKAHGYYGDLNGGFFFAWADANGNAVNMITPGSAAASFTGSPTHGAGGISTNGSSQFVNSGLAPSLSTQNSSGMSVYVASQNTPTGTYAGCRNTSSRGFNLTGTPPDVPNGHPTGQITASVNNALGFGFVASSEHNGLITANRVASTDFDVYDDGAHVGNRVTSSATTVTQPIYIGAHNNNGSPNAYKNATFLLFFQHDGMTATEIADFSADVAQLKSDLGL